MAHTISERRRQERFKELAPEEWREQQRGAARCIAYVDRVAARPKVQEAMKAEGLIQ